MLFRMRQPLLILALVLIVLVAIARAAPPFPSPQTDIDTPSTPGSKDIAPPNDEETPSDDGHEMIDGDDWVDNANDDTLDGSDYITESELADNNDDLDDAEETGDDKEVLGLDDKENIEQLEDNGKSDDSDFHTEDTFDNPLPNTGDDIADALEIDPEDITFGEDDDEKPTTENQEDGEPENGEPEDGELEDGEPEDSEPEDGEPVDDETNDVEADETGSADAEAEAVDNEATGDADDKDTEPVDPAGDKNTDPVEADDGEGTDPIEDANTFDSSDGENIETTKEDIEGKIGTSTDSKDEIDVDGNPLDDETPLEKVDNEDVAGAVDDFDDDAKDDTTDVKDKDDTAATTENPDDVDEFGFGAGDDDRLGSDDESIPEDPDDSDSEDSQPEDGEPEDSEPENGEPDEENTSAHDDVKTEIDETTPTDADELEATDDEETPNGSQDEDSEDETVTDSTDSDGEGAENGDIFGEEEFAEPEIDDTLNEDQPSDDNHEELDTGEGADAADDIFGEPTDGISTDAEENNQDDMDDAPGSNVGNPMDEEGTAPTHYSGHNSDSDKFEAELPATDVDSTGFGATRPTTTTSSGYVKYQGALLIAGIGIVGLFVVKRSRETIVQGVQKLSGRQSSHGNYSHLPLNSTDGGDTANQNLSNTTSEWAVDMSPAIDQAPETKPVTRGMKLAGPKKTKSTSIPLKPVNERKSQEWSDWKEDEEDW